MLKKIRFVDKKISITKKVIADLDENVTISISIKNKDKYPT